MKLASGLAAFARLGLGGVQPNARPPKAREAAAFAALAVAALVFSQAPAPARGGPELFDAPVSTSSAAHSFSDRRLRLAGVTSSNASSAAAREEAERLAARMRPSGLPVLTGRITSRYGWRRDPMNGGRRFHSGMDFAAPTGSPVVSSATGIVIFAGNHDDYGKTLKVYHGNGVVTLYAHNSEFLVKRGDRVDRGTPIGRVGATGRATGPHVHFEIRVRGQSVDPRDYLHNFLKPRQRGSIS